jgi:hypothetical protein
MNLNSFQRAFLVAALWSTNDESTEQGGEPLDANYDISDFSTEALNKLLADCDSFEESNANLLELAGDREQNGHDFWLTRCGHGCGFWDRGYDKFVSKALTEACGRYGNVDLYVGDDGKIHCFG